MPMSRFWAGTWDHVLSIHDHLADVGTFEAREHAQRGGLATSRGTEQRHQLPGRDVEGESVEGLVVEPKRRVTFSSTTGAPLRV